MKKMYWGKNYTGMAGLSTINLSFIGSYFQFESNIVTRFPKQRTRTGLVISGGTGRKKSGIE